MAVLIEAISVVIKAEVIEKRYPGGWSAFAASPPNQNSLLRRRTYPDWIYEPI